MVVAFFLRKRDVIILAVNSRVRKTSHKYGINVPSSVRRSIEIDRKNKNTFWQDALAKEMGNMCVAFEILGPNAKAPPGWHKTSGHIFFDLKMDFTRKARWVKDGHKPPSPQLPVLLGLYCLTRSPCGRSRHSQYLPPASKLQARRNTSSFVAQNLG